MKKRIILVLLGIIIVFGGTLLNNKAKADEQKASVIPSNTLRIHYQRPKKDYQNCGLWLWFDTTWQSSSPWPKGLPFDKTDKYGVYSDVSLKGNAQKVGMVVIDTTSGTKDAGDKIFTLIDKYKEIWIKQDDDEIYLSADAKKIIEVVKAEIISSDEIKVIFTSTKDVSPNDIELKDSAGNKLQITKSEVINKKIIQIKTDKDLTKLSTSITYKGRTVLAALNSTMIDNLYFYKGDDLGAFYNKGTVILKLWAPLSTQVKVVLFDKKDQNKEIGIKALTKTDSGVWTTSVAPGEIGGINDWDGYYYQYEVTVNGKATRVLDPYARSMAEFKDSSSDLAGKGAIINAAKTMKVKNYGNIKNYTKREDAIVYEIHVRDFTSDPALKTKAQFGTYKAFIEKLDYIKKLGVTHIQLLPVMAYYFGDESRNNTRELDYSVKTNNYNWGYDPHSYFSPDGMYSSNPQDPYLRINELKTLINAIHKAGMGVILDVVYNHTAKVDIFEPIVPGYYYRLNEEGNFTSASGCGDDVASTNKMVSKLIVDSLKYWTKEYKVDGFRFDLMGLIDIDTITKGYWESAKMNPGILFLGEGWKMYNGPSGTYGADQDIIKKTNFLSVFSDSFRDLLKFGGFSEGAPAFLTGKAMPVADIFKNQKGQPTNFTANHPGDVIQYLEAHDGLTYHDTICAALKLDPLKDKAEIYKRMKMGNLMLLTCQGVAFIHAGQEMARTKEWKGKDLPEGENKEGTPFIKNSYDSSDMINRIDWARAKDTDAANLIEYTKGLIAIRKSTDAFRLGNKDLIDRNMELLTSANKTPEDLLIAFTCKSVDNKKTYYILVNADKISREIAMKEDLSKADVIADAVTAGTSKIKIPKGVTISSAGIKIEPLTAVIIRK